jgi:hypothetical protein
LQFTPELFITPRLVAATAGVRCPIFRSQVDRMETGVRYRVELCLEVFGERPRMPEAA